MESYTNDTLHNLNLNLNDNITKVICNNSIGYWGELITILIAYKVQIVAGGIPFIILHLQADQLTTTEDFNYNKRVCYIFNN